MNKILAIGIISFMLFFSAACAQSKTDKSNKTSQEVKVSKYQDLSAEEFKAKMDDDNIVILDVRTDEEVAQGIIEGAIQIDIYGSDFGAKIDALDKSKEYLVYCRSGGRSVTACEKMQEKGFTQLNNLLGGYSSWPYK